MVILFLVAQHGSTAMCTVAYGVIGNTTVSGTVILGSSPGRPAAKKFASYKPRSSSGLGRRPLTPVTRVQIPYGVPPLPPSLRIVRALGGFALRSGCVGGALGGVSGGVGVMQSELNRYSNMVVFF